MRKTVIHPSFLLALLLFFLVSACTQFVPSESAASNSGMEGTTAEATANQDALAQPAGRFITVYKSPT